MRALHRLQIERRIHRALPPLAEPAPLPEWEEAMLALVATFRGAPATRPPAAETHAPPRQAQVSWDPWEEDTLDPMSDAA